MFKYRFFLIVVAFALAACEREAPEPPVTAPEPAVPEAPEQPEVAGLIDAALAGAHRSADNRNRDFWRNPKETLLFFGLEPDMTVVEIYPGAGWYTEVLAPVLRERGKLVAAVVDPEGSDFARRMFEGYRSTLDAHPDVFDRVEVITVGGDEGMVFGEPGSADMVLTFRNMHSFTRRDALEDFLAGAHDVLKPGGVLGVVAHRAADDADPMATVDGGYLPEPFVIGHAEAAGFRLEARSEINANPSDTRDHPDGVWALPPNLRHGDEDRDLYEAIGESDRMTLRFVKD